MKAYRLTQDEIEQCVQDYREALGDGNVFTIKRDGIKCPDELRPQVFFSDRARNMCKQLVNQCSDEIAWNGFVTRDGNVFTIEDVKLFPQQVTGTSVNCDPTEYAIWVAGLTDDEVSTMRAHCHSHVNMGTFSSNVDDDYQSQLVQGNVRDYYIFLIFNKKEDVFCRIYDVENNVFYDNADIDVHYTERTVENKEVATLIKEYVSKPVIKAAAKKQNKWLCSNADDEFDYGLWYNQNKGVYDD